MFGWVDFRKDGKKKLRKNRRGNIFGECLVEGRGGKKSQRDPSILSPNSLKCFLPKLERKLERT